MTTSSVSGLSWGSLRPGKAAAACIALVRHRIVRGELRKPIERLLARLGPVFDVEVNGLKLRCRVNDNVAETRAIANRLDTVARITRGLGPGHTFVDIGANSGVFTVHAAKSVGPDGCVLAVEPSPLLLERLRFNVSTNGFQNVRIAPVAVGDTSGRATLHVFTGSRGRSSLHHIQAADEQLIVPVEPLLPLLAAHGIDRIDAMKIDIEGYEDRALVPFFETAPRSLWPHAILIEKKHAGRWAVDCLAILTARGYRTAWEGRSDRLLHLDGG